MKTLKSYTQADFTNLKSFNSAISRVFGSIAQRNEQVQQLLVIAVNEAAKENEAGQVGNNLTWLSSILEQAENTKGVNVKRVASYVKEVLCNNTVAWDGKKKQLRKAKKDQPIEYTVQPLVSWMEHGKKETVAQAFDYGKRVTSSIKNAMDGEKGGLSLDEVLNAIIAAEGVTAESLMDALNSKGTTEQLAEALSKAA